MTHAVVLSRAYREDIFSLQLKFNLLQYVPRQLRELYQWLEVDFHPLKLSERVSSVLQWIREQNREPELVHYIPYLQRIVVSRVLQQVVCLSNNLPFMTLHLRLRHVLELSLLP